MPLEHILESYDQVFGPINIKNIHRIGYEMRYDATTKAVTSRRHDSIQERGREPALHSKEFEKAFKSHEEVTWRHDGDIDVPYQGRTLDCGLAVIVAWK